jgi:hypothetical protein
MGWLARERSLRAARSLAEKLDLDPTLISRMEFYDSADDNEHFETAALEFVVEALLASPDAHEDGS